MKRTSLLFACVLPGLHLAAATAEDTPQPDNALSKVFAVAGQITEDPFVYDEEPVLTEVPRDDEYLRLTPYYDSREGAFYQVWSRVPVSPDIFHFSQTNTFSDGTSEGDLDQYETRQNIVYEAGGHVLLTAQYMDSSTGESTARAGIGLNLHEFYPENSPLKHTVYAYPADTQGEDLRIEHYYSAKLHDSLFLRGFADHRLGNDEFDVRANTHLDLWLRDSWFLSAGVRYDSQEIGGDKLGFQIGLRVDLNVDMARN